MIKPKALKNGDTIGIVAPGSFDSREKLHTATKILEDMGYEIVYGRTCFGNYGYLSARDDVRAFDINTMFENPEIDAIFCLRGGYGSLRILDLIDYNTIYKNPKIFMGYSDITALLVAIAQKSELVTFHGPMLTTDFISPNFKDYTKDYMLKALTLPRPLGHIIPPRCEVPSMMLTAGNAEGELVGGNLSLLTALLGTAYEIDTRGKILFLEEIDEKPYRIDRMLTQLRLAGKLYDAEGIVLGQFTNCDLDSEDSLSLTEVFEDILIPLKKPIVKNVPIGHGKHKVTLPIGVKARILSRKGVLSIEEEGVEN